MHNGRSEVGTTWLEVNTINVANRWHNMVGLQMATLPEVSTKLLEIQQAPEVNATRPETWHIA
jgi:hypothetical protein